MRPLLAAAIGGISPYLVTLAGKFLTSTANQHFSDFVTPLFFAGLVILALIGAAVSFFLQETDLKKAFVLGISAPALITSTVKSANSSGNGMTLVLPNFITTAYAQNPAASVSQTGNPIFG